MKLSYNEHIQFALTRSAREVSKLRVDFLREAKREAFDADDPFRRDRAQYLLDNRFALNREVLRTVLPGKQ